eukprot:12761659-Alexandrium_andersonii.AAC.1
MFGREAQGATSAHPLLPPKREVATDDLEQGLARARGAALLKFRETAMGDEAGGTDLKGEQ